MNLNEHLSIEILADHAEGLLGDADSTSVTEHLASCADCSAEATLLMSVSELLAADDPGPMPAHFAARIDVALAELAAAEPVTPKAPIASSEGAAVIDLASRRRFSGASRVTSVAASLVLLIGGAALGAQMINSDDTSPPDVGALPGGGPSASPSSDVGKADAKALYEITPLPKDAKKGKNGSRIDKTGKVYLPNGTQIYPDGTRVIPPKTAGADAKVVQVTATKADRRIFTVRSTKPAPTKTPSAVLDPANPEVAEPTADPTTDQTPKASASPPSAGKTTLAAKGDPYVADSNVDYTPDNFAANVRLLLQTSGDVVATDSPTGGDSGANATQPRALSGAVRADNTALDRGPASTDGVERVRRCAAQLGYRSVIAGDIARWKGSAATIVVVANPDDSSQVIGYAVSGDCTDKDPVSKDTALWEQPVAKPGPATEESTTPSPSDTISRTPEL